MVPAALIRASACDAADVRAMLAAGWTDKTDTSFGQHDADFLISRGGTYRMQNEAGDVLGAYVLKAVGAELWIVLGAGRAGIDLTKAGLALIEVQGRQFDSIGFTTKRRGMVRKAQKLGYAIAAESGGVFTMRKKLT